MPLYEYRCRACETESELLVRASTTPTCPACGSEDLERMPSFGSVRSSSTHDLAMRDARLRDAKHARERVNEQRNYERNHD